MMSPISDWDTPGRARNDRTADKVRIPVILSKFFLWSILAQLLKLVSRWTVLQEDKCLVQPATRSFRPGTTVLNSLKLILSANKA